MNSRRVGSLVDALVSDRRPHYFKLSPTDANLMRVAIGMSALHPKYRDPQETFIEQLQQELALQAYRADLSPVGPVSRRAGK
jgi:hypothetical protein